MEVLLAGFIAFASTNVDDIFVLMLFFGNSRYKTKEVVIGQYIGITALITISFIGSFAGLYINQSYIGLLGLMPIFLGVRSLIKAYRNRNNPSEDDIKVSTGNDKHSNIGTIAAVTFANGGDNIGIYIPLFATLSLGGKLTMICIFLVMVALWCLIGKYLTKHPAIAKAINKYEHIITPAVLILLGIYILYESGSFTLIGR